jgi:hypothetical protein
MSVLLIGRTHCESGLFLCELLSEPPAVAGGPVESCQNRLR